MILGSSCNLPAHGKVGARARKVITAAKKSFRSREGAAGGGGEGEESRRARALGWEAARPCVSKEAKPAKIVSLIEKEFCARPLKDLSIFAGFARRQAASRWAGLPPYGRQLKINVRIFVKKSSDFIQKAPPIFRIRILGDCCLALATLGLGKSHDFERIFEVAKQFLPAQTEVRFAEGKHKFEKFINQSLSFASGERQSDNLILTAQKI